MNLGLHFRIFFPPLPSRALGEGRQQLYSSLPSARGRRRCLCLLWIYTCLHIQVALALTLLGYSAMGATLPGVEAVRKRKSISPSQEGTGSAQPPRLMPLWTAVAYEESL